MSFFAKNHKPGEGVGFKPPMDPTVFRWFCVAFVAIAVLAVIEVITLTSISL